MQKALTMRYAYRIVPGMLDHIAHIWPTAAELAADLGKPYPTVAAWKARGRIPADNDSDLIAAAKRRGFTLTYEGLALARNGASSPSPSQQDVA